MGRDRKISWFPVLGKYQLLLSVKMIEHLTPPLSSCIDLEKIHLMVESNRK